MQGKSWSIVAGPLAAIVCFSLCFSLGLSSSQSVSAAIAILCAIWWVLEPIPIAATSLIPFAAFPLFGVMSHSQVAQSYGHTLIMLLLGGFILSTAMEHSGAHKRIAFLLIRLIGVSSLKRLLFGFMLASALLSMWISNTATTLMLLPVALATVSSLGVPSFAPALLMGVAFSASVGGLGTPIGTPPNIVFLGVYKEITGSEVDFLTWMSFSVPIVLLALPLMWLWLSRGVDREVEHELPSLGPWRAPEKRVLFVFALVAFLWVSRTAPFGGWMSLFGIETVGDSTVALLGAILLFVLPSGDGTKLLDWESASKIPWGILILFGGGLAIASAFQSSGLSLLIGESLKPLFALPLALFLLLLCLLVSFFTEVVSNTATSTLLMPILGVAAIAAGLEPAFIMIPAALSASCAFMLPVATAPNAIVYGAETFSVREMMRVGLVLNVLLAVLISLSSLILLPYFFAG